MERGVAGSPGSDEDDIRRPHGRKSPGTKPRSFAPFTVAIASASGAGSMVGLFQ